MSSLTLYDEQRFNRDLGILFTGGLASGLVAAVLVAIAGSHQFELMALSFGSLVGLAAAFTRGDDETPTLRVILALMGGILLAGAFPTGLVAALFGGGALGLALSVDTDWSDRIFSTVVFGLALAAALFTTSTLFEDGFLQPANVPLVRELMTGGVWGTFMAAGAGLKQVRWNYDTDLARLREVVGDVGAAERGYLQAARKLYGPIQEELDKTDDDGLREHAERITSQTLRALERLTRRSTELRDAMISNPGRNLGRRLERIDAQLDATPDPSVREELKAARRELVQERQARERLETAITRLEVRQQRCITALERLHMNLVESGNADDGDVQLEASLDNLEELTDEIQWRNLSLDDICDPVSDEINRVAEFEDDEFSETVLDAVDDDIEPEPDQTRSEHSEMPRVEVGTETG
jgi:hypothetical protein